MDVSIGEGVEGWVQKRDSKLTVLLLLLLLIDLTYNCYWEAERGWVNALNKYK